MSDQKLPNTGQSVPTPGAQPSVPATPPPLPPVEDSVTFSKSDAFVPETPADEQEPIADAAHEQTFDVDSELRGGSTADVPINIVQPMRAPVTVAPTPATPPVPPPPIAPKPQTSTPPTPPTPPAKQEVPFVPPGFIPAGSTGIKSPTVIPPAPVPPPAAVAAPKVSSIREPRSFASITPLMMREPVEVPSAMPAQAPTPLRAPIPILQDLPGTPAPGTVTKQPDAPMQLDPKKKPGVPEKVSVLEQLREQTTSVLHPLRTYQTDAQVRIQESNASLVSVAAAEETRKARAQFVVKPAFKPTATAPQHHYVRTIVLVLGTTLLLAAGVGAVAYVLIPKTVILPQQQFQTPHPIFVDESVELPLGGLTHDQLMQFLTDMREKTGLSLGLMREVYFTLPTTDNKKRLATIGEVLPKIAPHAPPELLRTLDPAFLVGVHVYDGNQGFVLLKTNAYEQAYSAMLTWEPTMRQDLLPFLDRRPGLRLNSDIVPTSTPPKVINSAFVDVVLKNHDTRVLYNDIGDVIFLYSFLDRNTILITTNDRTLGEAISRIANP